MLYLTHRAHDLLERQEPAQKPDSHIWNSHGAAVIGAGKAEISDGSAFRAGDPLIALRFEAGEKVRFHVYVPIAVGAGEYEIGFRTAVQPDASKSEAAVIVDSNRVPVTVCTR